jgi:hypothetical protein
VRLVDEVVAAVDRHRPDDMEPMFARAGEAPAAP